MRIYLLRLLFIVTLTTFAIRSHGQNPANSKPISTIKEPLYILNSNIIGNGLIANLNPKYFKDIVVYKEQDRPSLLKNLTSSGVLAITYDGKINSKSFAEVGLQLGLHGPLSFVINGHKLDANQQATLRIAPEAIGQLNITPATSANSETLVYIQLIEYKTTSQRNARGTVMIR